MGEFHTNKERILIVEDEAIVAEDLELAVTNIGYDVVGRAVSANAAVAKAVELKPDLVLMDIVLQGKKNGIDAAHTIKERVGIPVIFLTAYSDTGLIDRARRTEPYAYIVKPFQEGQLLASIETALYKSRIEKRLKASERRLDLAVTGTNLGLWDWNIQGGKAVYNRQWAEMLGYTMEEIGSSSDIFEKLVNPDDVPQMTELLNSHFEGETPYYEAEFRMRTKSGGWKWILSGGRVFEWTDDGMPVRMIGTHRDITERKRAEEERERLLKELEAKNAEMERFNYTVSHDLMSPLTTVHGFANLLLKYLENDEIELAKKNLKYIERGINKMTQLLNDTLELSRVGRVANPSERVSFGELASEALEQLAEQTKSCDVNILMGKDSPTVYVDRIKMVEVLVNLIENSVKYVGEEPHPRIDIGYRTDDGETVFFVRDNGIGIDPIMHEKVFELFFKVGRSAKGTGAGLAIVKRIIEVHGGRVRVESEEGNGCTVCFTLPLTSDQAMGVTGNII